CCISYDYTRLLIADILVPVLGAAAHAQYMHKSYSIITHSRFPPRSHQGLHMISICSASVYHVIYIRWAPFAIAACWPVHKFSICSVYTQSQLTRRSPVWIRVGNGALINVSMCNVYVLQMPT